MACKSGGINRCGFMDCVVSNSCLEERAKGHAGMNQEVKKTEEDITFPTKVFVYGTLKRSYHNNTILGKSTFIRTASCKGILLHLGGFPGLLREHTGTDVYGEVWEIPDRKTLDALDHLEGHPHHYIREKIMLSGGEFVWTYIYQRYHDVTGSQVKGDWKIILSGAWIGYGTLTTKFLGFFEGKSPPKTDVMSVAHFRVPGEFSGLIDTSTGFIIKEGWGASGKPHLAWDVNLGVWKNVTTGRIIDVSPSKVEQVAKWEPYRDPADPGETDAPVRGEIQEVANSG